MSRPAGAPSSKTKAAREELRRRRQQAILDLALDTVTAEGHQALTMQRLAEELDCGIASVYRLFPSRDALIAELQHQALDVLHAAWLLGCSHLDEDLAARGADEATSALTRAVGAAWFWVVAEDRYASQVELARRLFVDPPVVPPEVADGTGPAALRLLEEGSRCVDEAAAAGGLQPGDARERAVLLIASITGIVLTARFGRSDDAAFDGRRLAQQAITNAFGAWGADPDRLATAFDVVRAAADADRLAPALERGPARRVRAEPA